MFTTLVATTFLSQSVSAYTEQALADQVTDLPGAESLDVNFNQFSGYLPVDGMFIVYIIVFFYYVYSYIII